MLIKKTLFFPLSLLLSLGVYAQSSQILRQAIVLKRQIERNHFQPTAVDDSFSSRLFSRFVRELDPQQNIFTAADFAALSRFRYSLDDELNGGSWKFLDFASALYKRRLKRADSLIASLLQKPLDLSVDEKITLSHDDQFDFAASTGELRTR